MGPGVALLARCESPLDAANPSADSIASQVKVGVALFLMMETTDFTVEPEIDKDLEKRLNSERRNKRRLWTAEAVDKYKIRSDEAKIKANDAKELEKSKKRPRRYVS